MPRTSKAAGSVAFVTGANRGIGLAFVQELAARGARKVYAGVRRAGHVTDQFKELPVEVVPLDVTELAQVRAAAAGCPEVNLLVNNAGLFTDHRLVLTDDPDAARREMEVTYFGVLNMTRAFAPVLGGWAELRKVGFAALDHAAAVRAATDLLGLGPGFGDPLLAELNLADFTAPIGPDTYLEVLAPTIPEHSVARWLRRVGGASGWVLATQVPSLDGVTERAAKRGVRIAVQTRAMGHDVVQLHPLDVGVLLELDEFLPRRAWFWDDVAAAQAAYASRSAKVDDIVAVDVAAADPAAMAETWAAIIGLESPVRTADGAAIAFGSRTIRFVPAVGGRTGIVAVDLHATDREHGTGRTGKLWHTLIRFV